MHECEDASMRVCVRVRRGSVHLHICTSVPACDPTYLRGIADTRFRSVRRLMFWGGDDTDAHVRVMQCAGSRVP